VISVEGEWGSGKSSIMSMIKSNLLPQTEHKKGRRQSIKERLTRITSAFDHWGNKSRSRIKPPAKPPVVIEFNPWIAGASDKMIQAFMAQIASGIGRDKSSKLAISASQQLLSYAALLEPLKWIPGAEPWTKLSQTALEKTSKAIKSSKDLESLDITKKRDRLKASLSRLQRKIIMLIDDIDRLPPTEVFQAIRSVQAVADLPYCSFVIALEPEYVEEALCKAAKFEKAEQYLDKIIQLRLSVPRINQQDLQIFFENALMTGLSEHQKTRIECNNERLSLVWHIGIRPLIKTPRDVIRIINRFIYIESSCGNEVCWGDLLGLQALAILCPYIHKHITLNPGAYTGIDMDDHLQISSSENFAERHAAERARALEKLEERYQARAQKLIELLFPFTRTTMYDRLDQRGYSQQKRVASSQRLKIALSYDLPSDEVSQRDINQFLYEPSKRGEIVELLSERGLLNRLMERVLQEQDDVTIADPRGLIKILGETIENNHWSTTRTGFRGLFKMSILDLVVKIAQGAASSIQDDEETDLSDIFCDPAIPSLGAHLIAKEISKIRVRDNKLRDSSHFQVSQDDHPLLAKWLDSVRASLESRRFIDAADKWMIIRVVARIEEGRHNLSTMIAPLLKSNADFAKILDIFIGNHRTSSDEDSISCDDSYLSILGDPASIKRRAQELLNDDDIHRDPRSTAIIKSIIEKRRFSLITGEPVDEDLFTDDQVLFV
jgi:predicted KAP-like P-loop ATPase